MTKAVKLRVAIEEMKYRFREERDLIANLANASAILNENMDDINWVGFYLFREDKLILGPFQGRAACVRIELGKGVCGTAFSDNKTTVVPNVHDFPGHIACDCRSNSEIVVPINVNGKEMGVLDIDSPLLNRFDEEDKKYLEEAVELLEKSCNWDVLF